MDLKHSNTQTLKHSNTQTLKHSNTQTLKHSNTQTLKHSNTQTLKHSNTQTLKHSNTQTLKHSNTQTLKHSNTQTLKHSNTQTLKHSQHVSIFQRGIVSAPLLEFQSTPALIQLQFSGDLSTMFRRAAISASKLIVGVGSLQIGAAAVALTDKQLSKKPDYYQADVRALEEAFSKLAKYSYIESEGEPLVCRLIFTLSETLNAAEDLLKRFADSNNPEILWRLARAITEKGYVDQGREEEGGVAS